MADVGLVIKISKDTVDEIKDNAMFAGSIPSEILWDVTSAIVNGTPLPKGHGRLIDADEAIQRLCGKSCGCTLKECGYEVPCFSVQRINSAPTIIEADKESEAMNERKADQEASEKADRQTSIR